MNISEILLLLNVLMLVPLGIMTVILGHILKTLHGLEGRISRVEAKVEY